MNTHWISIAWSLGVAFLCGGLVGWERGKQDKSAGLRTHVLVCMGSAAFTLIAVRLPDYFVNAEITEIDPSRVIQGIIGGIGFLGAGTIFRTDSSVHGLTTAASIWVTASIGIASGFGFYEIAIPVVVLTLVVNGLLVRIDPKSHEQVD